VKLRKAGIFLDIEEVNKLLSYRSYFERWSKFLSDDEDHDFISWLSGSGHRQIELLFLLADEESTAISYP
jgi:hypothetical protein